MKSTQHEQKKENEHKFDDRAIDIAGSSVAVSEMSTAINERKIRIWLEHKRKNYFKWMFTASMSITIAIFVISWFTFEALVLNNYYFTKGAFKFNQIASELFVGLAGSIESYLEKMNFNYCLQNGCLTAESKEIYAVLYPNQEMAKYYEGHRRSDTLDTSKAVSRLLSEVLDSKELFGDQITDWIKEAETSFNSDRNTSYYSKVEAYQKMPTLSYFQSVSSMLVRIEWLSRFEQKVNGDLSIATADSHYLDLRNSVLNDGMQLVLERCLAISESMNQYLQTSQFARNMMLLLGIAGAFLGVSYCFQITSLWSLQRHMNMAIEGYCCLKKPDLSFEMDKLFSCRAFFERGDFYDDRNRMSQALVLYGISNNRDKQRFVRNHVPSAHSSAQNLGDIATKKAMMLSHPITPKQPR